MKTKSHQTSFEDGYRTVSSLARLLEKDRKTILKYIKLHSIRPRPIKRHGQRIYNISQVAKALYC